MEKDYNICGENVKIVRLMHKMSQSALAGKAQLLGLNIDKKTISLIENRKRRFPDYELIILAKALQVPTFYITDGVPLTYMR